MMSQPQAKAERIAKVIARAGVASRRDAEAWIAAGRVVVNDKIVTTPALAVTAQDRIEVDGAPLPKRERTRLFLYYKPVGLVTTNTDPRGRPTVFSALPRTLPRLVSVGRLDIATEGLLLLTNDGGLARVLELPATGWLRRYRVRAHGRVELGALDRLRDGLTVGGIRYGPIEAVLDREQGANVWLTIAIREGKNREVRNVVDALGLQANRLIRLSFGPFQLGGMGEGEVVEVKTRVLRDQLGERIATEAGCDFAAPVIHREAEAAHAAGERRAARKERAAPARRPEREQVRPRPGSAKGKFTRKHGQGEYAGRDPAAKPQRRPRRGHAFRAEDAPLKRHYRGAGGKARQLSEKPAGPSRSGLLTDRKGRRVPVERFAESSPSPQGKPRSAPKEKAKRSPRPRGRPQSRDRPRGAGPRPSRPKPRSR